MASNGSCFIVTWTIFKNHLLEIGLTQNRQTVSLRTLTTVDLFYFMMCTVPAWIEIQWNSIWLRVWSHMASHYTWGSMTTLHDLRGVLGRPLATFFWALSQFHGHGSWLVCKVALSNFVHPLELRLSHDWLGHLLVDISLSLIEGGEGQFCIPSWPL
jgi:hypothetical protein